MSNSTINTTTIVPSCDSYGWYSQMIGYAPSISNPIYFVFGFSGRLISLVAIYQEKKGEGAYLYQVFVLLSEALQVFFSCMLFLLRYLCTFVLWLRSSYFLFWFTAYLAQPLQYVFMYGTNLLTAAMAIDRLFALMKPHVYGSLNHRKIQLIALLLSYLLSIAFSGPMAMVYGVETKADGTYATGRSQYWAPPYNVYLLQFTYAQYCFKGIIAVSLVVSGIMLCFAFQRGMKNRAKVRSDNAAKNNTADQMKTLFKMTLVQSICNSIQFVTSLGYTLAVAYTKTDPLLQSCVLGPTIAVVDLLIDILQFYITMAITKRFRKMVVKALKSLVPCQTNSVQVIEVQPRA